MFVVVCDADQKTHMTLEETERAGWGLVRLYHPDAIPDVDEFSNAMLDAAKEARKGDLKAVEKARKRFHVKYPDGLLPDEVKEEKDEEANISK